MRPPSARVLINTVDIWAAAVGQDADGAPQFTYPSLTAKGVACSVQAGVVEETVEDQRRIVQERQYKVVFPESPGMKPRDKMIYVDSSGVTHILFARVVRDEAGRGAAFVVRAIEDV